MPCQDRNADIAQYLISYCLASDTNCKEFETVSFADNAANRVLNITGLITRTNYSIKIRADHINTFMGVTLPGPFSDLLFAETDVIQGDSVCVCMYVQGLIQRGGTLGFPPPPEFLPLPEFPHFPQNI